MAVQGMVYKLDAAGQETTLYSFSGALGGTEPLVGLALSPAGDLYGTTLNGGAADMGVVYKLDPAGQETVLHSFTGGSDGGYPHSSVTLDPRGNVYGTATSGGAAAGIAGFGVVFKIDAASQETVLYTFTGGADGVTPGRRGRPRWRSRPAG
jgi:uncharacterized repeat protein (TIGR03803 family)